MAAAGRVIATVASTTATTSLVSGGSLRRSQVLSLCFNSNRLVPKKRLFTCTALYKPDVQIKEEGLPQTLDYRVFFVDNSGKKISPWHDVPLQLGDGVFNFIVEIPKESSAKMEVATDEPFTPIKQDTKKGKLRYYPYNINWNYGFLPQTWEDPSFANAEVDGALGDNDPVDVVEIGESRGKVGQIMRVKPLAALAMIDEGELDWKIVAISLDDPKASLVNDIDDVEKHFQGTLTAIRDWFRDYKIPDGKPANKFGLGNKAANKACKACCPVLSTKRLEIFFFLICRFHCHLYDSVFYGFPFSEAFTMEKGFSNTGIPLYFWVSSPDSVFSLFSFLGGRSTCSYSLDRSIMGSLGCHFGPGSYFKIGQAKSCIAGYTIHGLQSTTDLGVANT
ncbi:hypothetical protein Vadar_004075 [Vaccinium darrowii]|uniref:Uncharacterized protein n=1 Tax=Vaccinium darrowii TaxID=229202 RepID=A0ACB7ZHP8_9ERIC|nr:hypothetical protein Vadar_004075 [Vaccinium darrowii]